jgi:hypothetical protein
MNYFIAVTLSTEHPAHELAQAIQHCYDVGGADGDFQVLGSYSLMKTIIFKRDSDTDGEYIAVIADELKLSIEKSAMYQLALELKDGEFSLVPSLIELLTEGFATYFDFGIGSAESIAEIEADGVKLTQS